ncbi:MAG: cation-translocating P-type ATPase [Chloroflexi bacterium]|nr:cation-translocating P-type ATPase [Chloroflexota bacterium]
MRVLQQKAQPQTAAKPDARAWHTLDASAVLDEWKSNPEQGLSTDEIQRRLAQYGPNELIERKLKSPWAILWEQITNPLVLLLIFAAGVSALLGKADNVIAISAIVILNAILGVVQEYRAEQAMAALKKMAAPLVRVRRGSSVLDVQARELVPGDIILLEAGSVVPADSRLYESANLRVQEASLTGESQPVEKDPSTLTEVDAPLGDRHNMLYMGTSVTYGRGSAVVVETGMKTQLGRIAELIQTVDSEKTPLQRRMDELGGVLIRAAVVVMGLAFVVGLIAGDSVQDVLLNAVAIAVAVVPEGLPAVVTIALALGAQRMLRRNALIRKLPAVETLGSVTVICSDKTGTLTENRMTVTVVDVAEHTAQIGEMLKQNISDVVRANGTASPYTSTQAITMFGNALCNDVVMENRAVTGSDFKVIGDPTEGALVVAAARFGLVKPTLERAFPRVGEVPFESDRKRMSTIHNPDEAIALTEEEQYFIKLLDIKRGMKIAFTKGAVDSLLDVSAQVRVNGSTMLLTAEWRRRIENANNQLAQQGLRVLGLAYRVLEALPESVTVDTIERDLVFVGMVGIIDPPRAEVKEAVRVAKEAGIRPVMITGDHPLTAKAIARELNIIDSDAARVMTGHDLSKLSQQELENVVGEVSVYARVSPENKLNIVQALQSKGHIAAMTGDGVNDAPALKRADIGVAMGITGTAVSKEASDMVILDDNFATIVSAVEEGRTIYDNVRRFVKYLLASNTGELFVLLTTQLIQGMTIPLTTLQILWMNLITDGIPALALSVEKAERGGMQRPPYAPSESLFGRGLGRHIVLVGLLMGSTGLALGYWAWSNNILAANGAPAWNTMVFMFLTIAQMGHALGLRSHRETLFSLPFFGNRMLLGAVVLTVVLQLVAIYTPFFNQLFNTAPLTLEQLGITLLLSSVVFAGVELEKLLMRRGVLK